MKLNLDLLNDKNTLKNNLIFELSHAIKKTFTLYIAHELKLFTLLDNYQGLSLQQVCDHLNLSPRAAQALLSMCVICDLVDYQTNGLYNITSHTKYYLLEDSPFYWGKLLNINLANSEIFSYDSFKKAILTGNSQIYQGDDLFENNEKNSKKTIAFTQAMHAKSKASSIFWPQIIDLSPYNQLLDIGGGSGVHSLAAAAKWSHLKATIYDRPLVCEVAQSFIQKDKLEKRVYTYVGNMWEDIFPTADVHFYCDIFHDWPLEKCLFLANKSYNALPKSGRIIIHEVLFNNEKTGPSSAAILNLSMLMWTQGQQLSQIEILSILKTSGFKEVEIKSSGFDGWCIITGIK